MSVIFLSAHGLDQPKKSSQTHSKKLKKKKM